MTGVDVPAYFAVPVPSSLASRSGARSHPTAARKNSGLRRAHSSNSTVDPAFCAYRDLNRTDPEPYVHSSIQRSPVSVGGSHSLDEAALVEKIQAMPNEFIYNRASRLAQPDEVWHYQRGNGFEKAMLLANLLPASFSQVSPFGRAPDRAICELDTERFEFPSMTRLKTQDWPIPKKTGDTSDHPRWQVHREILVDHPGLYWLK